MVDDTRYETSFDECLIGGNWEHVKGYLSAHFDQ